MKKIGMVSFVLAIGAMVAAIVGCETRSSPAGSVPNYITGTSSSSTNATAVMITPASTSLSVSTPGSVVFTASGGTGEFVWTLSDPTLGSFTATNSTATYHNNAVAGVNTLTVRDSTGQSSSATITQS